MSNNQSESENSAVPTSDQITALQQYANLYGRSWKAELKYAWKTGMYGYSIDGTHASFSVRHLHQVRNQFGPSWLIKFQLPKA